MQLCKLFLGSILLFTSLIPAFSQSFKPISNIESVKTQIANAAASRKSIQANFQEIRKMSIMKGEQVSEGMFYYQKNDKLRWEQTKPSKYVILIDGDQFRVEDAGKEKNVGGANKMASQIKEMMMGLVNGDFQNNKAFTQKFSENDEQYLIVLTPQQNRLKKIYSNISLIFSKSSLQVKQITFVEKGGDQSVMKFSKEKINQELSNNLFTSF